MATVCVGGGACALDEVLAAHKNNRKIRWNCCVSRHDRAVHFDAVDTARLVDADVSNAYLVNCWCSDHACSTSHRDRIASATSHACMHLVHI